MNANQNSRKLKFSPFEICNVTQHAEIGKNIFVSLREGNQRGLMSLTFETL